MINNTEYSIVKAFERIENQLISSMMRNLKKHRVEEDQKGLNWTMWQVEQLKALKQYEQRNKKVFEKQFNSLNSRIENLIKEKFQDGKLSQEKAILKAIDKGFRGKKRSHFTNSDGAFFKLSERKLNALLDETKGSLKSAETAILRMANDKYRKIIFDAQVYANTGAGTYEKAVDMATKDFLSAGLNCVEYKNGARHTLSNYAKMAIRTASKRAYLQGEGNMRKKWGISTVIVNKRGNACPRCLPFVGKVMIDDVWSGGSAKDGEYMFMSTAIAAGLYHPNCKDSHTTYFEGITTSGSSFKKEEIEIYEREYKEEQKRNFIERETAKWKRLADNSLDGENKKKYKIKAIISKGKIVSKEAMIESKFQDVTNEWLKNKDTFKQDVEMLKEYAVNGKIYKIDGINVKHNNSKREIEVAKIVSKKINKKVFLVPEISGMFDGIKTPDYLIDGKRWDLKELKSGKSRELLRNIVHKKREQAENFIFDITESLLEYEEIERQAKAIFNSYYNTKHVEHIMIIKDEDIIKIYEK